MNKTIKLIPFIYLFAICLCAADARAQVSRILVEQVAKSTEQDVVKTAATQTAAATGKNTANTFFATVHNAALQATSSTAKKVVRMSAPSSSKTISNETLDQTLRKEDKLARISNSKKTMMFNFMVSMGVSPRESLEILQEIGAHPVQRAMPKLADKTYEFASFAQMAPALQTRPAYPFSPNSKTMYRGMALEANGTALKNIFENGLLLKDVRSTNNQLLLSHAGPHGRSVAAQRVICFTNSPEAAAKWAQARSNESFNIPVVVHVKNIPTGETIMHGQDVPAEQILRVSALLNIDGQNVWGLIRYTPQGTFSFTPYK